MQSLLETLRASKSAEDIRSICEGLEDADSFATLTDILSIQEEEDYREEFSRAYALLLFDEDQKWTSVLDAHMSSFLDKSLIAYYYGIWSGIHLKDGQEKIIPWTKKKYHCLLNYYEGIACTDNLALYLEAAKRQPDKNAIRFCSSAAAHDATKMMDYFGYDLNSVKKYIEGIFRQGRKETLDHLLAKTDQKTFEAAFKAVLPRISIGSEETKIAQCIAYLISKERLSFSSTEWRRMEMLDPEIYSLLHNDV